MYQLAMSHLKNTSERIQHATKQHPEGPSFDALTNEIIELREAIQKGEKDHILYELYDVIAVSFRLIIAYERGKIKI